MTDATYLDHHYARAAARQQEDMVHLPTPQAFAAPVFIHDCVTPLAGETVLSLLMKRMMAGDQP
ncbi:MAG: hypothetical protein HKN30_03615 [Sulfitobacter sp.]|nr:hypothetical protein [Sulfitobacter sp.]